jgi:hypothetical protein
LKRLHYLLVHAYCLVALGLVAEYVLDQYSYQHAVIAMMRFQALALQSIGHSLAGHAL